MSIYFLYTNISFPYFLLALILKINLIIFLSYDSFFSFHASLFSNIDWSFYLALHTDTHQHPFLHPVMPRITLPFILSSRNTTFFNEKTHQVSCPERFHFLLFKRIFPYEKKGSVLLNIWNKLFFHILVRELRMSTSLSSTLFSFFRKQHFSSVFCFLSRDMEIYKCSFFFSLTCFFLSKPGV